MKKFLTVLASVFLAATLFFCGCTLSDGRDGRDGKDGKDVSITEIYEKYVESYGEISYADFLKEYLNYTNEELDSLVGLQAKINKSLMCGVSILSRFAYGSSGSGFFPGRPSSSRNTYKVYTGSGVILWLDKEKGDAYVATNCHVVYDDTSVNKFCDDVRLYLYGQDVNGVNFSIDADYSIRGDEDYCINAEILGASVSYDVALLKVTGSEVLKNSNADVASFSDAYEAYVGESVYAIGNASGEGLGASEGIISRDSEQIELSLSDENEDDVGVYRVLRTTAAINHGNSGGALYNAKGEIVGLVNAKDDSEDVDNMGYVLPANNVRRILKLMYDNYVENGNRMLSGGGVKKARLNVVTQIDYTYSLFNSVTNRAEIYETIKVSEIAGSPASGNLKVDDVIKNIKLSDPNGNVYEETEVRRNFYVSEMLFSVRAGDTVTLTVLRGEETIEVPIKMTESCFTSVS